MDHASAFAYAGGRRTVPGNPESGSCELRRSVDGRNFPSASSLYQPEESSGPGIDREGTGDVVMEDRNTQEEVHRGAWLQNRVSFFLLPCMG